MRAKTLATRSAARFAIANTKSSYLAAPARARNKWLAAESGGEISPPARTAGRQSCALRRREPTQAGRRRPLLLLLAVAGVRRADSASLNAHRMLPVAAIKAECAAIKACANTCSDLRHTL
eukprot:COSAG06_NODE_13771_length_1221_cov_1.540107_1_plen_121_part_00